MSDKDTVGADWRSFVEAVAAKTMEAVAAKTSNPGKPCEMVDHPDHYTRGPKVDMTEPAQSFFAGLAHDAAKRLYVTIECIEVIRHIRDMRLATAMKYVWRVAFGGKPGTDDAEDIRKAIFYLNDWLENRV